MATPKLRDLLLQFLKGSTTVFYPVVEARVLQVNPLQITDDLQKYLDISSLQEGIQSRIQDTPAANYKLTLKKWSFVFKKVPNSHEFYFDIVSGDYSITKELHSLELDEYPSKMVDDDEIRYHFEMRKRKELEEIIKLNMRFKKTGSNVQTKTADLMKATYEKSPLEGQSPLRTPTKSTKSAIKDRGESYIQSGGKTLICPEILTIEELLDLPIPIFSKESIQRAYYGSNEVPVGRAAYQADLYGSDPNAKYPRSNRMSVDRHDDEDTLGKRFGSRLTFDEILKGLTKKLITWNAFVFSHKTFDHLKERPFLLEEKINI